VAQGTSASARIEPLHGRSQDPPGGPRSPDDLRDVPPSVIDQIDARIARVRAELALLRAAVARRRENGAAAEGGQLGEAPANGDQAAMIALNMALNGASRAETDRYLSESFGLRDGQRIVQDAFERVRQLRGGT
jgi:hypothetical protein